MFTLHNETHICNVMQLMADILGDDLEKLTRDEAAMLIMSACCHDVGMSYSNEEKEELFSDYDRLNKYLDNNHSEYVRAFSAGSTSPVMTDDMIQNYLRSIHHGHLSQIKVKAGQAVKITDVIGIEGSTGKSTGSHCHYCIRPAFCKGNSFNVSQISGIPNSLGTYDDGYRTGAAAPTKSTRKVALMIDGVTYEGVLTEK